MRRFPGESSAAAVLDDAGRRLLAELQTAIGLDAAQTATVEREADALADAPLDSAPVVGSLARVAAAPNESEAELDQLILTEEVNVAGSRTARKRDIEKAYPRRDFIAKLRRLADALERDERFSIQVAGRRVVAPRGATVGIEHERERGAEEIEFQLTWKNALRRRRKANP